MDEDKLNWKKVRFTKCYGEYPKRYTGIIKKYNKNKYPKYYYPMLKNGEISDKKRKVPTGTIIDSVCDYIKKPDIDDKYIVDIHDSEYYMIHDNGGIPFKCVLIDNNILQIYIVPDEIKNNWDLYEKYAINYRPGEYHSELIEEIKYEKIFIGESPLNNMTTFSGGHGDNFYGNSILLKIKSSNKNINTYVYIGSTIYQFNTIDEIHTYWSPVGNSDVPYPFAIGNMFAFFMLDESYVLINEYNDIVPDDSTDSYSYFYGHEGPGFNNKFKMENIQVIKKRKW